MSAPPILDVVRRVEACGALETAHRVRQNIGEVFEFAIAAFRALRNPVKDVSAKFALSPRQPGHFAAITEPAKLGDLLRAIDDFTGTYLVRCALKLAPLVFARPGELRTMKYGPTLI